MEPFSKLVGTLELSLDKTGAIYIVAPFGGSYLTPRDARRLAKLLLKAAEKPRSKGTVRP